jgi:dTDP-4-dehydrorhamnose 3,5-epimerase
MKTVATEFEGLLVLEPTVFSDARGFLLETWNQPRYAAAGVPAPMVQDNLSRSVQGVVRGLHFQNPRPQAKLVFVLEGEIFDVAVDVRRGSPTFGRWFSVRLSAENKRQLYIPVGFAHGFGVLSPTALVSYKCSDVYQPEAEMTILWNDPRLAIDWPISNPIVSPRDAAAPTFDAIPPARLPAWQSRPSAPGEPERP